MIKGYISGSWDLLHAGHVLAFKEAKEHCNYLVVGFNVDPTKERPWKMKSIETFEERMIRLEGCKYVDKILPYYSEDESLKQIVDNDIDIRFLGDDYKDKDFPGSDMPIKFYFIDRSHGYSSSNLKQRIKNE